MADPTRAPGESDPNQKLPGPDYYREELQLYADRYTADATGRTAGPALFESEALLTLLLTGIGRTVRFVVRSWFRWWRLEPQAAAVYTLAWTGAAALWLTWPSAPGHATAADLALWIRLAAAIAGVLVIGGIPGAFLAKRRVTRRKSAQNSRQ